MAAVGYGGSDRQYFYGCSLLLAVAADGPITGFVIGPADTQERWLLDVLVVWQRTPARVPWTVADIPRRYRRGQGRRGPTGPRWYPDSLGKPGMGLYLAYPKAKTMWGLVCRVAAKCAACNLGIRLNREFGRPDLALATLFPG
jgi:hypothetical protein